MEARAYADFAFHKDVFAKPVDNLFGDGKPKSRSAFAARFVRFVEPLEYLRQILGRNTAAGVGNVTTRRLQMLTAASVDTTVDSDIDVTYQWVTASPNNSITHTNVIIRKVS